MAVEQLYTGNGSTTNYTITFPFLLVTDVEVSLAGVTKSNPADYGITGSTVIFVTAPSNGTAIKIWRNTNIDDPRHSYVAGSSIKADYLNTNHTQLRHRIEEVGSVGGGGGSGLGLTAGDKNDITVNTADDWVIRDNSIEGVMLQDNTVTGPKILNNSIIKSKLGADCVDGTKIEDDSIDSEHYVDKSIDAGHIADKTITNNQIAGNSIDSAELIAGSVDISHLSATGTPSSANCLRGDNTWATLPTNNNQLTNGAGYLTSLTGAVLGLAGDAQIFTSSGSYTAPANAEAFTVILVGGGGGRSYTWGNNGVGTMSVYGGGGGGTCIAAYNKAEMGAAASVTIGAGGTGETYLGNSYTTDQDDQVNGGTTSLNPAGTGATATATGGVTGVAYYKTSGTGGLSGTSNAGGSGTNGAVLPGGVGGWHGNEHKGGRAVLGGDTYGAGAHGASCSASGSYQCYIAGEAGKAGCCIVIAH